eukprot:TRINITY_DN5769_c0_g4_i1.p1 TRINITY_DN5769_c0_g4~~TRINITY_DN5769_c0_g4_i1.p1  ORF type:complete len:416 (+),score=89.84 TRINITY_DN5769_c0_g4_i1:45-1250(+)
MGKAEYTEEPTVVNDFDYYADLTKNECVEVRMVEGKGKGAFALADFDIDDEVIRENALACAQNLDDVRDGIKVCAATLKSLETPKENLVRVCRSLKEVEVPCIAKYPSQNVEQCDNTATGCKQLYSSKELKTIAWYRYHQVLCKGLMSSEEVKALEEYEKESWIQGGIDYSDTFHLALHFMAIMFSGVKLGSSVEEVFTPFSYLISCPWERFTFTYLLDKDQTPQGDSEEDRRTKEETLAKAMRLMRTIFQVGENDELLTEHRFTRILGAVLLNGQERVPNSPWACYQMWLRTNGTRQEYKSMKSFSKNNPDLASSTKGQGVYRVCSCFNHSCEPNIQVMYSDDNDETLVVHAIREIKKGDELCISYIDEDASYNTRQEQLRDHYLFTCICPKCTRESTES